MFGGAGCLLCQAGVTNEVATEWILQGNAQPTGIKHSQAVWHVCSSAFFITSKTLFAHDFYTGSLSHYVFRLFKNRLKVHFSGWTLLLKFHNKHISPNKLPSRQ